MGFRPGRGCADATFVLRRLLEETHATYPPEVDAPCPLGGVVPPAEPHVPVSDAGLYVLFVDLRKAFDTVPREVLWRVLRSCGVPEGLVHSTAAFHEGMGAHVKHRGLLSDRFALRSGVRQGAVEAPTLWDLHYHFVLADWRSRLAAALGHESGVVVSAVLDGRVDRRRGKVWGASAAARRKISELAYADDLATLHVSFAELEVSARLRAERPQNEVDVRSLRGCRRRPRGPPTVHR